MSRVEEREEEEEGGGEGKGRKTEGGLMPTFSFFVGFLIEQKTGGRLPP
jgi:hypothetical protein